MPTKHRVKAKGTARGAVKRWNVIVRRDDGTYTETTVEASSAAAAIKFVMGGYTGAQRDAARYYDAVRVP